MPQGEPLDRACRGLQAATCRPVRLGKNQNDLMARREQARQRTLGKFRSTGES